MSKRDRERQRRMRRQAEAAEIISALRTAGKNCGNCVHFERAPLGMAGYICDLNSDFHGYQSAKADGLCHQHRSKP